MADTPQSATPDISQSRGEKSADRLAPYRFKPGERVPWQGKGPPKGSGGRPKDELRAMMRQGLEEAIPALLAIVRGERSGDVVAAANVLARYGVGTSDELETKESPTLSAQERHDAAKKLLKLG